MTLPLVSFLAKQVNQCHRFRSKDSLTFLHWYSDASGIGILNLLRFRRMIEDNWCRRDRSSQSSMVLIRWDTVLWRIKDHVWAIFHADLSRPLHKHTPWLLSIRSLALLGFLGHFYYFSFNYTLNDRFSICGRLASWFTFQRCIVHLIWAIMLVYELPNVYWSPCLGVIVRFIVNGIPLAFKAICVILFVIAHL